MKKGFKNLGMVISIGLVILGVLIMTGTFRDSASYPNYAPSSYDSGYAIFGADFYNFVCNNSAEAADAAAAAANNTVDIINLITGSCGVIVMALGLLGFCFFGMMPTGAFKVQNIISAPVTPPVSAPVYTPVVEAKPSPESAEPTVAREEIIPEECTAPTQTAEDAEDTEPSA